MHNLPVAPHLPVSRGAVSRKHPADPKSQGAMAQRSTIPTEIRRAVLVEAGHRCAIPTCKYSTIDLHHIIPWETCQTHDFDNLIALCPNCHRRADAGEIDRKALRLYKTQLSAALGAQPPVEIREPETLSEIAEGRPGYEYEFQSPHFSEADLRPVSLTLQAWGHELLQEHRSDHYLADDIEAEFLRGPNTTSASYEIVRNDPLVLSIKYRVNRYYSGAAHGNGQTVTWNYWRKPLFLLGLNQLFSSLDYLEMLSALSRSALLDDQQRNRDWVFQGTEPEKENFRSFNIAPSGLLLTFDAYQVDCFAAGPQVVEIPLSALTGILNPRFGSLW